VKTTFSSHSPISMTFSTSTRWMSLYCAASHCKSAKTSFFNILNKMEKESHTYLDPQIMVRTNLHISQQEVVAYFVKAMRHYRDKEMLVVPFNTGNHWVTLSISTKYYQVWYCDSSRPTDAITGDRLTRDWTNVITILDE
jgi:hypothetical protein